MDYYIFKKDDSVDKPIDEMAKILIEKNWSINRSEAKEFLVNIIGEIFVNSRMHSKQEEIHFIFDIVMENDNFYLWINILNYGKLYMIM